MIEIRLLPALLFCSGAFSLFLALYALNIRRTALSQIFALFAGGVAVYAFGYGLELMGNTLGEMLFWSKAQYVAIAFLPGLILSIAICYTEKQEFFTPLRVGLIFMIPLVTLGARLSNPFHHLFYRSAEMLVSDHGALLSIEPGPLYLLHVFYSNAAWLLSFFLLLRFFSRAARPYRRQTLVIIIGSSIQWFGYVIYLLGLGPAHIDLNPLLLTITLPVYAFGMFKLSLFSLIPVARDKVFEDMRDAVIVLDPESRLVDFNRRCTQLFPKLNNRQIGFPISNLFADYPDVSQVFSGSRSAAGDRSMEIEMAVGDHEANSFFHLSFNPLLDKNGKEIGSILTFTDITSQKKFVKELEEMATIDELTGLHNRRHLMVISEIEMHRYQRNKNPFAILMMDLDHFKAINDTWGHGGGDTVLRAFSTSVKQNIRAMDIFGRYGGEEFMILMPETAKEMAIETAHRICRLVENLAVPFETNTIKCTVSIGVSGTWGRNSDLTFLIQEADKALYAAKHQGRNQAVLGSL